MTCTCGLTISHSEFIQSIGDGRIPFEVYHWHCPSCFTLMEELRLAADQNHPTSSSLAYPVQTAKEPTLVGV